VKPRSLEDFGGEFRMSGTQLNYKRCPMCGDMRFKVYVNAVNGMWDCKSGSCHASGRIGIEMTQDSLREKLRGRKRVVPKWEAIDMPEYKGLTENARNFIYAKWQVSHPDKFLLRLGTGDLEGRILIPYPAVDGTIIYLNSRAYGDNLYPKYKCLPGTKPLYVPGRFLGCDRGVRRIALVEGPFDAMSVVERVPWVEAIALGGKQISEAQLYELVSRYENIPITILLDQDALSDAMKLKHRIDPYLVQSARISLVSAKDPAETTTEELREVLS